MILRITYIFIPKTLNDVFVSWNTKIPWKTVPRNMIQLKKTTMSLARRRQTVKPTDPPTSAKNRRPHHTPISIQ